MPGLSSWEIRKQSALRGYPVSGKQFNEREAWGVLPKLPDGGWSEEMVDRLVAIEELGPKLRLHRRIIRLRNLTTFIVPPENLREAMIATLPSIVRHAPIEKARSIHRAYRVKSSVGELLGVTREQAMSIAEASKLQLPVSSRPPESVSAWEEAFKWPDAETFDQLAGKSYHAAFELGHDRNVQESGFLTDLPFEELVIFLLTHQLTIGNRVAYPAATRSG